MPIEKQATEPAVNEAVVEQKRVLGGEAQKLDRTLGPRPTVPDGQSQGELVESRKKIPNKNVFGNFEELFSHQALVWREKALQLIADIKNFPDDSKIDRRLELITANQAITYNEYFPAAIRQISEFMSAYEREIETILPNLKPAQRIEMKAELEQSVRYLHQLRTLMQDRLDFASIINIDTKLRDIGDGPGQQEERQELEVARSAHLKNLRPETKAVLAKELELREAREKEEVIKNKNKIATEILKNRSDHILASENQIIEMLKGNPTGKKLEGAPKDFLPQRMYLRLVQQRYNELHEIQTEIARGEGWSKDFTLEQRNAAQIALRGMRRQMINELTAITQQFVAYHGATAEMTAIQHQFGDVHSLEGANRPFAAMTPDEIRKKVETVIDGEKDFHIERLQAMVNQVDRSFDPNGLESLTDAGTMSLLGTVDKFSGLLRGLITVGLPEGAMKDQINKSLDTNLPLALADSLESQIGPNGKPITKEQKMELIRDVIIRFRDTGCIKNYRQTLNILQSMPKAQEFVLQEVQPEVMQAMAGQRFTESPVGKAIDVDGQKVEINGATAYALMIGQMKTDSEAFGEGYKNFLQEMENLVDVRLFLVPEANQVKEGWLTVAQSLGIGATAATIIPWVAGGSVGTMTLWALRKTPGVVKTLTKQPGKALKFLAPSKLLLTGGTAIQAYRTYEDFKEIGEIQRELDREKVQMVAEIRAAGFEADPPDQNDIFRYKDGSTEVVVNIKEIRESQSGYVFNQAARTGFDAAELFMMFRAMRAGTAPLRAAPPVIAVEITAETIMYGIDQKADRTFLNKCPAWLLAKINVDKTIGDSKYGMLATASEAMLTLPSEEAKKDIREKMLFTILHEELAAIPTLKNAIYPAGAHPAELDTFFKGEFKDVFLKYYYIRLQEFSDGALPWEQIKEGRVGGTSLLPARTPDVSLLNVRKALREAAVVYTEHCKEREYQKAVSALNEYRKQEDRDPLTEEILKDAVQSFGSAMVFNKPASEAQSAPGITSVQSAIDTMFAQLEKGERPSSAVNGVSLTNSKELLQMLPVALQKQVQSVFPRTLRERDNADNHEWHDWGFYRDIDVRLQRLNSAEVMGAYGGIDFPLSLAQGAVDNIRRETGKEKMALEPTLLTILGPSGDQATIQAALDSITGDATELFSGLEKKKRGVFRESEAVAKKLYGKMETHPLVYLRGEPLDRAMSLLAEPGLPREYSDVPLKAVFFDCVDLKKSGHSVTLATYVYGNPEGGEVFVVRRAAGSAALARTGKETVAGLPRVYSVEELQRTPGMTGILDVTVKGLETRTERDKRASIRMQAENREADFKWRNEQLARTEKIDARKKERAQALERARKGNESAYLPPEYRVDDRQRTMSDRSENIEFVGRTGDTDYEFSMLAPSVTSVSALKQTSGILKPEDFRKLHFSAMIDGKKQNFALTLEELAALNPEIRSMARDVLTRRLNIAGHPLEKDANFVQAVRRFELGRILDAATYQSSIRWYAEDYRTNLFKELLPLYEAAPDKQAFLGKLLSAIEKEKVVTGRAYGRILSSVK